MAVVSFPKCCWNVGEDRNQFFFKDPQILVRRLAMNFGYRFLSDFLANVRSYSHSCKVMLSALVIVLSDHC
jgi:hypothetical protein